MVQLPNNTKKEVLAKAIIAALKGRTLTLDEASLDEESLDEKSNKYKIEEGKEEIEARTDKVGILTFFYIQGTEDTIHQKWYPSQGSRKSKKEIRKEIFAELKKLIAGEDKTRLEMTTEVYYQKGGLLYGAWGAVKMENNQSLETTPSYNNPPLWGGEYHKQCIIHLYFSPKSPPPPADVASSNNQGQDTPPDQIQAQSPTPSPDRSQAQSPTPSPDRSQAQSPTPPPDRSQAQYPTPTGASRNQTTLRGTRSGDHLPSQGSTPPQNQNNKNKTVSSYVKHGRIVAGLIGFIMVGWYILRKLKQYHIAKKTHFLSFLSESTAPEEEELIG